MNPLLRLAGWYADTLLKSWFPQEKEPSLEDLERSDALGRLVCLVEDIRNTVSSVVSEAAAETPGEGPSTSPGNPNLSRDELFDVARAVRAFGHGHPSEAAWNRLADKVNPYK